MNRMFYVSSKGFEHKEFANFKYNQYCLCMPLILILVCHTAEKLSADNTCPPKFPSRSKLAFRGHILFRENLI